MTVHWTKSLIVWVGLPRRDSWTLMEAVGVVN